MEHTFFVLCGKPIEYISLSCAKIFLKNPQNYFSVVYLSELSQCVLNIFSILYIFKYSVNVCVYVGEGLCHSFAMPNPFVMTNKIRLNQIYCISRKGLH